MIVFSSVKITVFPVEHQREWSGGERIKKEIKTVSLSLFFFFFWPRLTFFAKHNATLLKGYHKSQSKLTPTQWSVFPNLLQTPKSKF